MLLCWSWRLSSGRDIPLGAQSETIASLGNAGVRNISTGELGKKFFAKKQEPVLGKMQFEARKIELKFAQKQSDKESKPSEPVSIETAVAAYIAEKRDVERRDPQTMIKYEVLLEKQLKSWSLDQGLYYLVDLDSERMHQFRQALAQGTVSVQQNRRNSPVSLQKKQERLSGFFNFCVRRKWISTNPMSWLSRIKPEQTPTLYFTKSEFEKIIDCTYVYDRKSVENNGVLQNAARLRTMTWLLRWSGLSLGDAISLERSRLTKENNLLLYRHKTGVPVYVTLPQFVANSLRNVPPGPKPNPLFFFWSGNGSLRSSVKNWQRSFRRLFELADLKNEDGTRKRAFPHMFRDTFAVEYLLAGMPLEQVSVLLGHKSVKTTERYYAPFVRARQQQLIESQQAAWKRMHMDPKTGVITSSRQKAER